MSRRLVEAGVSPVQVNWFRGPDEPTNAPCWDSHASEAQRLKTVLCPPADQGLSALIEDLETQDELLRLWEAANIAGAFHGDCLGSRKQVQSSALSSAGRIIRFC